jgi:hypothetical protein
LRGYFALDCGILATDVRAETPVFAG